MQAIHAYYEDVRKIKLLLTHLVLFYKVLINGEDEDEEGREDEEEVLMIEKDIGDGATNGN